MHHASIDKCTRTCIFVDVGNQLLDLAKLERRDFLDGRQVLYSMTSVWACVEYSMVRAHSLQLTHCTLHRRSLNSLKLVGHLNPSSFFSPSPAGAGSFGAPDIPVQLQTDDWGSEQIYFPHLYSSTGRDNYFCYQDLQRVQAGARSKF